MIRKISSFACALAILQLLEADERLNNNKNCYWVEAYQNGREQGITIWNSDVAYYIAHHRNGDQPVVYKGSYSMQSVSEDAYKHKNFFCSIEECVRWLIEELTQENKVA